MGSPQGRRHRAFWGARRRCPWVTSGQAGSRRRRAHAGWAGVHLRHLRFQVLILKFIEPRDAENRVAFKSCLSIFSILLILSRLSVVSWNCTGFDFPAETP